MSGRNRQGYQTRIFYLKGSVSVLLQPFVFVVGNVFIPLHHLINKALLISFQKMLNKIVKPTYLFHQLFIVTGNVLQRNRKITSHQTCSVGIND